MSEQIAQAINVLGHFCGMRDVPELTQAALQRQYGFSRADVMVLFGGSILCGGDVLAAAMRADVARKYVIVGGAGHTTETLRQTVHALYPSIETAGLPEAEVFSRYISAVYGVEADLLETASTNCGNNIANLLSLLQREGIPCRSIILCQDATMQRRMAAGLRKYVGTDMAIIHYAAYQVEAVYGQEGLTFREKPAGMWNMARYIELLMGEIPRLTDGPDGYGPCGKGYIAHEDIPDEVQSAYETLRIHLGVTTRAADPRFASVPKE